MHLFVLIEPFCTMRIINMLRPSHIPCPSQTYAVLGFFEHLDDVAALGQASSFLRPYCLPPAPPGVLCKLRKVVIRQFAVEEAADAVATTRIEFLEFMDSLD